LFAIYILLAMLEIVLLILTVPITEVHPRVSNQCINKCQQFLEGGFVCGALSLESELHVPTIRATSIHCESSSLRELITAKKSIDYSVPSKNMENNDYNVDTIYEY
jgi:hypothetical protein